MTKTGNSLGQYNLDLMKITHNVLVCISSIRIACRKPSANLSSMVHPSLRFLQKLEMVIAEIQFNVALVDGVREYVKRLVR